MVGREQGQAHYEDCGAVGREHVTRAAVRQGDLPSNITSPELGHSAGVYPQTHCARPSRNCGFTPRLQCLGQPTR